MAPQGLPGVLNFTTVYYTLATLAYRGRSWAALEVCVASQDVSGELPEALWRRVGSSWGALGALFWQHFLMEKQLFSVSDWKTYAKRVST